MKKVLMLLAALMLYSAAAFADGSPAPPVFSVGGGVYSDTVTLELNGGGSIYYTTDGSLPTSGSTLYTGPIVISAKTTEIRMGMDEAPAQIPAGTVIRAAVISGGQTSAVVNHTYFIGTDVINYFGGVPLVNLTVTPYDLWDRNNGIYSNYNYEHKVPAVFQHFNTQGVCDINRTIDVKVSGHGSRSNPKKSLRVYFKNTDPGQGKFLEYPLIPGNLDRSGREITKYSKVTFRISDYSNTDLRDVVAQRLGAQTRADTAASVPKALFLNGEYWGLYECREQYDDDYVAVHYGLDNDDVVFFDRDWTLPPSYEPLSDTGTVYVDKMEYSSGPDDGDMDGRLGESYYRDQWNYVKSLVLEKDITSPDVYAEFCANVDIDNFIDYIIIYIFSGNDDWPGNNFKLWRVTEESVNPNKYGADGKWRFMIHDFDIAFEGAWHDTLRLSAFGTEPDTEARHPAYATQFIAGLLKNPDFRNEFAQRTRVYLSTVLSKSSMQTLVDDLISTHQAGKTADLLRWGWGPAQQRRDFWLWNMSGFVDFASARSDIIINQYTDVLNSQFNAGITGTARVMLTSAPEEINGVHYRIGGAEAGAGNSKIYALFAGIPVTVSAEAADGTPLTVTVSHRGALTSGAGEVTFTLQPNEPYTVSVAKSEGSASTVIPAGIARAGRFETMTVGESLPAVLFGKDGSRLTAEFTVTGSCVSIENGIVKALSPGRAVLSANYNGLIYSIPVTVM